MEPRIPSLLKANEGDELDKSPRHGSSTYPLRASADRWRSAPVRGESIME